MPLSDDARLVLLAEQILRQAGWRGEPFLGVKLQDPTWTRARWEQAQAGWCPCCMRINTAGPCGDRLSDKTALIRGR
jgi:hypothetical protein